MAVTSVTLGNFYTTSNGKTVLGGAGGSGLDSQTLIKSLVDAKSLPATRNKDSIKINDDQSAALNTLNDLLSVFQASADALRNPPGVGNAASNAFAFTSASVSLAGSPYISVTSAPGAAVQSYTVKDISSVASTATQGAGTFTLDSADEDATVDPGGGGAYFVPGTITFDGDATVTVNEGDSLSTIASNFNAVSDETGIRATIIQIDDTHYTLSFSATASGEDGSFDLDGASITDGEEVLANLGLTAAVEGTNAEFKLNGVAISRQSNTISDVVSGVTFTILAETPDAVTNYDVTVAPDRITVQNTIVSFVNAYNAIKTFAAEQTSLDSDGTYAETAVLANNQTFRQTISNIVANVVSQVQGIAGSNPSSFADVGITFTTQPATTTSHQVNDILTVDDDALSAALANNFNGVKGLFGFTLTSNNAHLAVFSRTNALAVSSFTITKSGEDFVATYGTGSQVTLTAVAFSSGDGYTLTGPSGSVLDGLKLLYGSNDDAVMTVTATQGIADKVFNTSVAATKASTGTLAVELAAIKTRTATLNEDIDRINVLVDQYQQLLLKQFSALEAAISKTNTLLQSLSANANAALAASGN